MTCMKIGVPAQNEPLLLASRHRLPMTQNGFYKGFRIRYSARMKCKLMAVLNVTPDSFSDGGKFLDPRAAAARAEELIAQDADVLDLGAESTRPGSRGVAAAEQIRRLLP